MPTPTAPILAPYTSPPPAQTLTLITSVLSATSNWLILRFLCDALSQVEAQTEEGLSGLGGRRGGVGRRKRRVVLVSFLRGWEFWRIEARRIGLDLARLANEKNFAFVDGLSELFSHDFANATTTTSSTLQTPGAGQYPQRHTGPLPIRSPVVGQSNRGENSGWKKLRWSKHGGLDAIESDIVSVIDDLNGGSQEGAATDNDALLVIDQPDLLLAATGPSMGIGATEISEMIMGLRQRVHATIVTLASDSPLVHNAFSTIQHPTPLETEHAGLVVGLAHQSRMVLQLRELDTGVAKDVSGVLRASKGGQWDAELETKRDGDDHAKWDEREVLYFVQGDGAVRVFERGE
ncbi:hypothetical protein VTO42DRAFT_1663 [Malbranchea cinnamomea]